MTIKRLILIIFIQFFFSGSSQSAQLKTNLKFDEGQLLKNVEILSSDIFEGRETAKKGNDSARAYIIEQFNKLNIRAFNENYEQPFTFKKSDEIIQGTNILASIIGTKFPEKFIVVSAHYDHIGIQKGEIYNGADDNASGVSALLAFTEYFKENPPTHSVIFAAFDAEEIGLQGAKHFVNQMEKEKILLNINMDMISRSSNNELYVVGGRYTKKLDTVIKAFENPTDTKLLQGHDGTDSKQNWTMSSDHAPFHQAGIPFLYFGNEDHDSYHEPSDDFENITPQFYINSVKIILSILIAVDSTES